MASRRYAERNPEVLALLLREINAEERWIEQHIAEAAAVIAPQIGVSQEVAETALQHYAYGVAPISDAVVRQQQAIADAFHDLKLIPKRLDVAAIVWRPARVAEKS
jgi:sulfonate transport system substrate-binding protein